MSFDESGESDNFWTPGPVGPCGPCVEFYYDRGEKFGPEDWDMGVNDRYTEIWNNVMMAYYRDGSGSTVP
jgi:alanyl-tRNA synthetase